METNGGANQAALGSVVDISSEPSLVSPFLLSIKGTGRVGKLMHQRIESGKTIYEVGFSDGTQQVFSASDTEPASIRDMLVYINPAMVL